VVLPVVPVGAVPPQVQRAGARPVVPVVAAGATGRLGVRELVGVEGVLAAETEEETALRRVARREMHGVGARVLALGDPGVVRALDVQAGAVEVVHHLAAAPVEVAQVELEQVEVEQAELEQEELEQVEVVSGVPEVSAVRVRLGSVIAMATVGSRVPSVDFPHASRAMRRSAEQPRFGLEEADFAARAASARTRHRNRKPNGSMRDRFARRRWRRWSAPSAVEPRRTCRPRSRLKSMGYRVAGSAEPIFASAY
jgi:hypothetical protein